MMQATQRFFIRLLFRIPTRYLKAGSRKGFGSVRMIEFLTGYIFKDYLRIFLWQNQMRKHLQRKES